MDRLAALEPFGRSREAPGRAFRVWATKQRPTPESPRSLKSGALAGRPVAEPRHADLPWPRAGLLGRRRRFSLSWASRWGGGLTIACFVIAITMVWYERRNGFVFATPVEQLSELARRKGHRDNRNSSLQGQDRGARGRARPSAGQFGGSPCGLRARTGRAAGERCPPGDVGNDGRPGGDRPA